ncbi:hypothetical protein LY78DRAFT_10677 [Colletotrichum sublineola]|nr:hypothetical protein LY78DRAFT_10677 [Colletotrichum sublineola]
MNQRTPRCTWVYWPSIRCRPSASPELRSPSSPYNYSRVARKGATGKEGPKNKQAPFLTLLYSILCTASNYRNAFQRDSGMAAREGASAVLCDDLARRCHRAAGRKGVADGTARGRRPHTPVSSMRRRVTDGSAVLRTRR